MCFCMDLSLNLTATCIQAHSCDFAATSNSTMLFCSTAYNYNALTATKEVYYFKARIIQDGRERACRSERPAKTDEEYCLINIRNVVYPFSRLNYEF